jgi:6-phosphogluconolactonase (cycloisomerase 2 family)
MIPDPTGNFVLMPDLGEDLVRVFQISHNPASLNYLTEVAPLTLAPGSTPRHGTFVPIGESWYFYILNQNANTLLGFRVIYYTNGTLGFVQVSNTDVLLRPDGSSASNATTQSSELHVSVSPPTNGLTLTELYLLLSATFVAI